MKKIWITLLSFCAVIMLFTAPVSAATYDGGAIKPLKTTVKAIGNENVPTHTVTYSKTPSDVLSEGGLERYGIVIPFFVPEQGMLYIDILESTLKANYTDFEVCIYKDSALTQGAPMSGLTGSFSATVPISVDTHIGSVKVKEGGNYYLAFLTNPYSISQQDFTNTVKFRTYFYSSCDKTLTSGTWNARADLFAGDAYYKIVLPSDGHIRLESKDPDNWIIGLYDSNKQEIDSNLASQAGTTCSLFLKKGTYYLYYQGALEPVQFRYQFYPLGSGSYKISNGKTLSIHTGSMDESLFQLIKYKATSNGYITVADLNNPYSTYHLTLCNSAGKAISEEYSLSSDSPVFGVKKGKTYYLKLSSHAQYGTANIKLTAKSVNDKAGTSKKKAVSVKAGKQIKGILTAGEKASNWYKFTLSSSRKVTLWLDGKQMRNYVTLTLYNSKNREILSKTVGKSRIISSSAKLSQKLAKGTYYVKISRKNKLDTGMYTLKWK